MKNYSFKKSFLLLTAGLFMEASPVYAGFEFFPSQPPVLQTPQESQARRPAAQVPLQNLEEAVAQPVAPNVSELAPPNAPVQLQQEPVTTQTLEQFDSGVPRSGRFEINPFPVNLDNGIQQEDLLYGQPVPTTLDSPVPLYTGSNDGYDLTGAGLPAAAQPQPGDALVQGFGQNLPLALAVQQIIPSGFSYSFQKGVDLSSSVTWEGGKSWRSVLTSTLQPLGYGFDVEGDNIVIAPAGRFQAVSPEAYPAPITAEAVVEARDSADVSDAGAEVSQVNPEDIQAIPQIVPRPAVEFVVEGSKAQQVEDILPVISATAYKDVVRNWTAPRQSSLREILEAWTSEVDVDLHWASEYDYPIQTSVNRRGTFEEAARTLLEGLRDAQPRPNARLHPNLPNGPAVMIVTARKALN